MVPTPNNQYERRIEAVLRKRVLALGGLCEKFYPGQSSKGRVDRIITLPGGRIIFVECKKPGEVPRPIQLRDHRIRRELGCDVRIIDNVEDAEAFPGD